MFVSFIFLMWGMSSCIKCFRYLTFRNTVSVLIGRSVGKHPLCNMWCRNKPSEAEIKKQGCNGVIDLSENKGQKTEQQSLAARSDLLDYTDVVLQRRALSSCCVHAVLEQREKASPFLALPPVGMLRFHPAGQVDVSTERQSLPDCQYEMIPGAPNCHFTFCCSSR